MRRQEREAFLLCLALGGAACGETPPEDGNASGGSSAVGGQAADGEASGGTTSTGGASGGGTPGGGTSGGQAGQGDGGTDQSTGGSTPGVGGSSGGGGATGGDGGASPGGGSGGSDHEVCGPEPTLHLTGSVIEPMVVLDQSAPVPSGGALVDGIYDLTSSVFYEEFPVETLSDDFRQVIRVRDGALALDTLTNSNGQLRETSVAIDPAQSTSTAVHLTMMCPDDIAGGMGLQPYSAMPGQLVLFVDYGAGTAVNTHSLRE